jgi:DNA replication protein DnaC
MPTKPKTLLPNPAGPYGNRTSTETRVLGRYARLDLLCLDEIGYLTLDPRGAELLFQRLVAQLERLGHTVTLDSAT